MQFDSKASFQINCPYDSHVHWQATGEHARRLDLSQLRSPEGLKALKVDRAHMRGEWLLGFGWDENKFDSDLVLHRETLDELFPKSPVKFSRADGHAAWVNTEALKRAGLYNLSPADPMGGKIHLDDEGWPTGLLIDQAINPIDHLIPGSSAEEVRADLLEGARIFNRAGFTHIRDMTCDEFQWQVKCGLAESGDLTLAVEQNFSAKNPKDFHRALSLAVRVRKDHPKLIRPLGVKIFLDGALGSEGAYISADYPSGHRGVLLIERIALKEMIRETWSNDLDIAIHCIGDEATHITCSVAAELWEMGEEGRLHIEHAQMLRPESLEKIQAKDVICHLQPCHWLSDKLWLKEKLGDLYQYVFPWAALEEAKVRFHFGSDSPIEKPDLFSNFKAIKDSEAHGVPALSGHPQLYQQHFDGDWVLDSFARFEEGQLKQLVFGDREILSN